MKRIKDFSKIIGIICRGGRFHPSNDLSEQKLHTVFEAAGVPKPFATTYDRNELELMGSLAERAGFKLLILERGLNR